MNSLTETATDLARHARTSLIALDFDGTLAPIVDDPEAARPVPGAISSLETLASSGARVALMTGREAQRVLELSGAENVPRLLVAGVYGAEMMVEGQLELHPRPENFDELHGRLESLISELLPESGASIEDKRVSLVIHVRQTSDPSAALSALETTSSGLAHEYGVETHTGKAVLEFRLPGFDKGRALRKLVELSKPANILVAGDDQGDIAAFTALKDIDVEGHRWSVAVTDDPEGEVGKAADLVVGSPEQFTQFLKEVAAQVDDAK